jgi:hypothetical protein
MRRGGAGRLLIWRGLAVAVDWADGQQLVADAYPRKFCFGSSGEPLLDRWGAIVGLVSRWPSPDRRGCSARVKAVAVESNLAWLRAALSPAM